jgi:peptide/nickel transport system permease protein
MMPGDIALEIAAARYGVDLADDQTADYVRKQEGLDKPLYVQYARWLAATLSFNLGRSVVSGNPVAAELWRHFGYTLKLAAASMLLSIFISLPLGVACGLKAGSWLDTISAALSCALVSIPSYVLGAGLIFLVAISWRLLPAAGFTTTANLVLPSLTLALALCATSNRVVRTAVAEVNASFHTVFASMKNLPQSRIILGHILRNASVPVATFLGLQFAHLLDGVVVVEVLFNYPGIGKTLLTAIVAKDLPMLQGAVLVIGLLYVTINALTDLACIWIDPRQNRTAQ